MLFDSGHPVGVRRHNHRCEPRPVAWADIGLSRCDEISDVRNFQCCAKFSNSMSGGSSLRGPTIRSPNGTARCQPRPSAWVARPTIMLFDSGHPVGVRRHNHRCEPRPVAWADIGLSRCDEIFNVVQSFRIDVSGCFQSRRRRTEVWESRTT
jgi:hypothetical protein